MAKDHVRSADPRSLGCKYLAWDTATCALLEGLLAAATLWKAEATAWEWHWTGIGAGRGRRWGDLGILRWTFRLFWSVGGLWVLGVDVHAIVLQSSAALLILTLSFAAALSVLVISSSIDIGSAILRVAVIILW